MKKLYILFIILISINSNSQSFSLNELLSISKMDLDTFDTTVTNKGFVFNGTKDLENYSVQYYKYNDIKEVDGIRPIISLAFRYVYKQGNKKSELSHQTSNKNDYVLFKKNILLNKYKFIRKFIEYEGMTFTYSKGKTEIRLHSEIDKNTGTTIYLIEITNYQ
jgi:hypothetical protein